MSLNNFGPWLFNHLSSLEELSFNPSDSAPHMGNVGQNPAYIQDIGLTNATMPSLKRITLANIFICAELTAFLQRHSISLERIALLFCRAYVSDSDDASDPGSGAGNGDASDDNSSNNTWSTLFKSLSSTAPSVLEAFTFTTSQDELVLWSPDDDWLDSDLVEAMYRKRKAEPDMLLFPYYEIWDGGRVMRDMEANIRSFLDGDDYRAFLGLTGVLKGNGTVEWDRKGFGMWKYIPVSER